MRTKMLFSLLLLCTIGAWAQVDNCDARSNPTQRTVKCPCTSAMLTITVCQSALGGGGQGCSDTGGGAILCGSNCGFIGAVGCRPGGPRISIPLAFSSPLERELKAAFGKTTGVAVQTCGDDGAAFEKWLLKTSSRRHAGANRGM